MKQQIKFTAHEQIQQHLSEQQTGQQAGLQFDSVEAMLRHDAVHTPVPPTIAHRLQESLGRLQTEARPWWRRWLGS